MTALIQAVPACRVTNTGWRGNEAWLPLMSTLTLTSQLQLSAYLQTDPITLERVTSPTITRPADPLRYYTTTTTQVTCGVAWHQADKHCLHWLLQWNRLTKYTCTSKRNTQDWCSSQDLHLVLKVMHTCTSMFSLQFNIAWYSGFTQAFHKTTGKACWIQCFGFKTNHLQE